MKTLVIGGTGPTGPVIVQGLAERGYEPVIMHRGSHEVDFTSGFETAAVYADHVVPFMRRTGQDLLQDGKARAEKAGVRADTVLLEGMKTRLCDAIAEQASAWGAELIVIGTHGRRGVGRMLLGSDAEQIVRTAPVPVLLVRAPQAAADVPTAAQAAIVKQTVAAA